MLQKFSEEWGQIAEDPSNSFSMMQDSPSEMNSFYQRPEMSRELSPIHARPSTSSNRISHASNEPDLGTLEKLESLLQSQN